MDALKKYVFVVGAGASKEFNLPTGAELKNQIARFCDIRYSNGYAVSSGDPKVADTLKVLVQSKNSGNRDINPYLHAGWQISDGMPLAASIDNFLDTHREDQLLVEFGKLAIAGCIRAAERCSTLWFDEKSDYNGMRFENVSDTWIGKLFTLFSAGRDFHAFLDILSRTTFVVFNYDRCIEHFFLNSARRYFSISNGELDLVSNALKIRRPYGSVGEYRTTLGGSISSFGEEVFGEDLITVSEGLRTFTEGAASVFQDRVASDLDEANYVFFLGFGFLPLNMSLLLGQERICVDGLYGTAKGLSKYSCDMVEQELVQSFARRKYTNGGYADLGSARLKLTDVTCADLIYEYQRLFI